MKQVIWVGSSLKDVGKFPSDVQDVVVSALDGAREERPKNKSKGEGHDERQD